MTLQLKMFLDLTLLFFNSISSTSRGLSVHLLDLMISEGKKGGLGGKKPESLKFDVFLILLD